MSSVAEFLKRASERNGFVRDRFEERKIPTDHSNIVVMPFFGDYRGMFILSSLLLHRYREEVKASKYFILASWPGFQSLFPYVDEYWSIADEPQIKRFFEQADGLQNRSELSTIYFRNLNEFFRDVVDWREFIPYYNGGIQQDFWEKFKVVKRFLPLVPSAGVLGKDFSRELVTRSGYKVLIHPSLFVKRWQNGRTKSIRTTKEFWLELVDMLLSEGFVPVVWQSHVTFDLSSERTEKCLYVGDRDISKVLAAMRATGCVLDTFNGISRLAIAARSPFLALDERSRYSGLKEYEIDDLCSPAIPKEYIFTFSTIITDGTVYSWKHDLFQNIAKRLNRFLPELNRDAWPSTAESREVVLYETVRKLNTKKLGTRLLKITRD